MRIGKKTKALALGGVLMIAVLGITEVLARVIPRDVPVREKHEEGTLFERDGDLSYRLVADHTIPAQQAWDGKELYSVTYRIDADGRRRTVSPQGAAPTQCALFLGDSITFGYGLEDEQSVASLVAAVAPTYKVRNFGVPGWGPHQSLALLESGKLAEEVTERGGFAVYTLIDAHIRRCIGSMREMSWWGRAGPYYELSSDGAARRLGSFDTGRPWTTRAYVALSKSRALQRFGVEVPALRAEHFDLLAAVLAGCRDRLREQFGIERFYVFVMPETTRAPRIVPLLEQRGLGVLDYSTRTFACGAWKLDGDGHPNAAACVEIANWIADDLKLR